MRLSFIGVAAAAMVFAGCSSSSSSTSGSSSGSTGKATSGGTTSTSTTTAGSTTTSGGTTGHTNATTAGSTSGSTGGSTSTTTSGGSSGSTGSLCKPSTASSSGSGSTGSASDFSCLGHVPPPANPTASSATLTLTLTDQTGAPLAQGLTIKPCSATDATCTNPVGSGVDGGVATTDATGTADVVVQLNNAPFTGYFDVSGKPDTATPANSVLPMLVYAPPITQSFSTKLIGVRQGDADNIAGITNVTLDPSRGQVIGNVADCASSNAQGAVVSASNGDSHTVPMYFQLAPGFGEVPSPSNPDTDATGNYIIANVPVGSPSIAAYVHASCAVIGQRTVYTRAGTVTNVLITPQ